MTFLFVQSSHPSGVCLIPFDGSRLLGSQNPHADLSDFGLGIVLHSQFESTPTNKLKKHRKIPLKTFAELNLIEPLQRALDNENYHTPTPIQARTIPAALDERDILGCAQTGTGKTAAFALPVLNRLGQENRRAKPNRPFVLVLAPTRELAIQIGKSFTTYGKNLKLRHALVYGGVNQNSQVQAMNRGSHILVATPGRLIDLMNQGYIKLDQLEVFILDEADRMLDMGFLPDLRRIIRALPKKRQSLFFSATIAPEIVELTKTLLRDPVCVNVTPKSRSVDKIKQRVIFVPKKGKQELLTDILSGNDAERAIVFTKTKRTANIVSERLNKAGLKSVAIHGNKSQNARQRALDAFRKKFVKVLVATDVAARGIDIDGVTHVINFDIPHEAEAYVHRIGRTGRAGAKGVAVSFCSPGDQSDLSAIERLIGQPIAVDEELSVALPRESQDRLRGSHGRSANRSSRNSSPRKRVSNSENNSGSASASAGGQKRSTKRRRRRDRTVKAADVNNSRRSNSNGESKSRPATAGATRSSTANSSGQRSRPADSGKPKRRRGRRTASTH